jgi:hypothetical protein
MFGLSKLIAAIAHLTTGLERLGSLAHAAADDVEKRLPAPDSRPAIEAKPVNGHAKRRTLIDA